MKFDVLNEETGILDRFKKDLEGLGYEVKIYKDYHQRENCYGSSNEIKFSISALKELPTDSLSA